MQQAGNGCWGAGQTGETDPVSPIVILTVRSLLTMCVELCWLCRASGSRLCSSCAALDLMLCCCAVLRYPSAPRRTSRSCCETWRSTPPDTSSLPTSGELLDLDLVAARGCQEQLAQLMTHPRAGIVPLGQTTQIHLLAVQHPSYSLLPAPTSRHVLSRCTLPQLVLTSASEQHAHTSGLRARTQLHVHSKPW